jgi:hypothetical protein
MNRSTRRIGFTGIVLMIVLVGPSPAQAGPIFLSLATGASGTATPVTTDETRIDNPQVAVVAISQLSVGDRVHAWTGGGAVYFGGAGTPVVLDLSDGRAYLSSSSAPADAAGAVGSSGSKAASAVPQAGGEIPPDATLLRIALSDPGLNGGRTLSAGVVDAAGSLLGRAQVAVPDGGWWILGLGPGDVSAPPPEIVETPEDSEPSPPAGGGPPGQPPVATTTPEPSAVVLTIIGVGIVAARRGLRPPLLRLSGSSPSV